MFPHLAARLFGTPLLVQRAKLDLILAVLSERLHLPAPEVERAPPRPRPAHLPGSPERSIAVLPIHGTLVKRTLGLEAASGLMSYQDIGARLEAALDDPLVAGIVLDIDSPGGETGGCFELARRVREAVRAHMRSAFQVRRASFVASMQAKVYDHKPERLPALWVGSRIPWLGIHAHGGTVTGRMLIPLLPTRIGPKRFRRVIDGLMRSGNAFFVEKNGRVLLMAENLRENAALLARFKRAERARTGAKQIKRSQEIPIAVLARRVDLRRRFDLPGAAQRALPALARAIEQELVKL